MPELRQRAGTGVIAVLGCPLHNNAHRLESAIVSLLEQTRDDVAILLFDDASTDTTPAVAAALAARDPRVRVATSTRRLGLAAAWNAVFEWARAEYPEAPYFAWGSDHDLWMPEWLERLVDVLEANPETVLAYPITERIGNDDELLGYSGMFETAGLKDRRQRVALTQRRMGAGSMVYGLVRAEAIERAGGFKTVLEPDRLLLLELAMQGEFRQVPEPLWRRRYVTAASRQRQRAAIFLGRRTLLARLPPWVGIVAMLLRHHALERSPIEDLERGEALELARAVAVISMDQRGDRLQKRLAKRVRRARAELRKAARQQRKHAAKRSRRAWGQLRKVGRQRVARARKSLRHQVAVNRKRVRRSWAEVRKRVRHEVAVNRKRVRRPWVDLRKRVRHQVAVNRKRVRRPWVDLRKRVRHRVGVTRKRVVRWQHLARRRVGRWRRLRPAASLAPVMAVISPRNEREDPIEGDGQVSGAHDHLR